MLRSGPSRCGRDQRRRWRTGMRVQVRASPWRRDGGPQAGASRLPGERGARRRGGRSVRQRRSGPGVDCGRTALAERPARSAAAQLLPAAAFGGVGVPPARGPTDPLLRPRDRGGVRPVRRRSVIPNADPCPALQCRGARTPRPNTADVGRTARVRIPARWPSRRRESGWPCRPGPASQAVAAVRAGCARGRMRQPCELTRDVERPGALSSNE